MGKLRGRREFSGLAGAAVLAELVGCGGSTGSGGETGSATGDGSESTTADPGSTSTGGPAADTTTSTGPGDSTTADESDGSSGAATGSTSEGDTESVACEPSPGSIEGPFYRPDIPIRSDLDLYGDSGAPLLLSGRVVDADCAPVAGAVVELWHATPAAPDAMPGDDDATYDASREYRYYGQVATDRDGRYAFETLRPGWYLNGNAYRPAHLHVKIWVDGVERLTTQLYFADDPFNDGDPWFDETMVLDPDGSGAAQHDFAV